MTVTYVILSHRLPRQVLRLAETLRAGSPGAPLVIHHDPRGEPLDMPALLGLGGIQPVQPARPVAWGWASQLDALLRSLRWALLYTDFDWLVVLSGQDYPVRPLRDIEADLAATAFDGFIQDDVVPAPGFLQRDIGEFASRYHFRHHPLPRLGNRARRAVTAARPLLTVRRMPWGTLLGHRTPTPFTAARPCRRGQDWLTLSRRCVQALDDAVREEPRLLAHYRHVPMPTESLPHTVLHARRDLRLSTDPRRFSAWEAGAPHPRLLTIEDLDAILASGTDFARKLDLEVGPDLFDALDRVTA